MMADEDLLDKPQEQQTDQIPANEPAEEPVEETRELLRKAVAKQRETPEAPEKPAVEPKAKATEAKPEGEKSAEERERDEKGRFAPKAGEQEAKPAEQVKPEGEKPATDATQQRPLRPPPGWSVAAKAEFDKLSDPVKQAIVNREAEVDNGFKRYGGLKQFADIAEKGGTTLANAVGDYYKIETGLRQDFIGGVEAICQRFGVDPKSLAQVMAQKHGISPRVGPADEQQQPEQQRAAQQQLDPQELVRRAVQAAEERFGARETQTQIQAFSSDPANKFFENVKGDMAILLQNGKASSLKDAYDQACWLNPETRAILLQQQIAAQAPKSPQNLQQVRQAAKAVNGAPSPGFSPGANSGPDNRDIRQTIQDAVRQARGA